MHDDIETYTKRQIQNATTAVSNLFMFLPYFFSVDKLLKTLFAPWKNIVTKSTKPGFSFDELGRVLADNLVSRFMGFSVRSAILLSFVLIQVLFVILLPGMIFLFVLSIPLGYALYISQPTPASKKEAARNRFMMRHLAEPDNKQFVEQWFEMYYKDYDDEPWWTMKKLMSQPPLGRDLTSGYTPTLDQFSTDLSSKKPHYRHLIGRKGELEQVQQILSKTGESNVLLVGDEGVGRRTIVEALAASVHNGTSNQSLVFKRVIELHMEKILASTQDFVKREETIGKLFVEAANAKNIILLIDNFDQYISDDDERINLSNVIEKYASLPTLQFIGITTPYLYQKYIFSNKQIESIFDKVDVNEMTQSEALTVLLDVGLELEKHHGVPITYEAVKQAIIKTDRFITNQPLPEKAIDLIDEACVFVKSQSKSKEGVVNAQIISMLLEQKTHVPSELTDPIKQKLLTLEQKLQMKIFHQSEAVHKLTAALRKSFVMAGSRNKPLASFLFLGPTGVGKTATAKAVTTIFFNNEDVMMRFDMSLYQSTTDIPKLIGSSTTGEPGLMTEAVRRQRFGTLLLDELEKADKNLLNVFLTILDEGYYTDGFGNKVDCSNLIVIATSNAGADFIYNFMKEKPDQLGALSSQLIDHLVEQKIYSPEFLNRFDGVLVYKPLTKDAIIAIAQHKLQELRQQIQSKHNINVSFSDEFVHKLIQEGYDPRFGARNMERIIRDEVEDKIAQVILEGKTPSGNSIAF